MMIRHDMAQKTNFWPALYLPTSGKFSSWLVSTSRIRASQVPSSRFQRLALQNRRNNPAKEKNSTTPIHGWIVRVHWPPPNRPVRENTLGWHIARTQRANRVRLMAVIQWLTRAPAV